HGELAGHAHWHQGTRLRHAVLPDVRRPHAARLPAAQGGRADRGRAEAGGMRHPTRLAVRRPAVAGAPRTHPQEGRMNEVKETAWVSPARLAWNYAKGVAYALRGGGVSRYHTLPRIVPQNVAEHSYGVAWYCWALSGCTPSAELLM